MYSGAEKVMEKYADILFRIAYGYCNNREEAEDILQETIYRYLIKKPEFQDENHEKAWLIRVIINISKNYVRSFWRKNIDPIENEIVSLDKEDLFVWDTIQSLPDKYRIVIQLHYIEGYTIREIAGILEKKESTIGTWLERAKKYLRQRWED
ncbi:MAG: RNA polymerase sigma factor [Lachnospiraceae bacterium]|nr:RNA polymerase sigma factor [Lachnospiraceae bacterium]